MKILVCGDRNWHNYHLIEQTLSDIHSHQPIQTIIEGEARGADSLARLAGQRLGIPVMRFPADWSRYGRAAGFIRNQQMLDEGKPDLVLAFHNDIQSSKGTKDMVERARKASIETQIISI